MQKSRFFFFIYFFRLFIFWMIFFALNRAVFLIYNTDGLSGIGIVEMSGTFYHAIPLDISASSYILSFIYIILLAQILYPFKFINYFHMIYVFIVITAGSCIYSSELGIYDSWKTKLNFDALSHLSYPAEVIRTTPVFLMIILVIIMTATILISFYLYRKFVISAITSRYGDIFLNILFILITPGLLILGIRGGFDKIPIMQSDAYFSKHPILNNAAVNSPWNLGHSWYQNRKYLNINPYNYYDYQSASETINRIYQYDNDSTLNILSNNSPNIVFIILESWSADLVHSLGGYKGITPCFNSLCEDGVLFTGIHAAGNLSHEGMVAIFSGFPAQPVTSIIKQPDKYPGLPSMISLIKQRGYNTAFIYGGELTYGNIKSYLYFNGFDLIIDGNDFDGFTPSGNLTIYDEFLFQKSIQEINKMKEPFFCAVFTGSSHSPYDVPIKPKINMGSSWDETGYVNAVYYSDSCLGRFMRDAKKEKWYNRTLFIFISDHSHNSPRQHNYFSPEYRKIPLLFYGNVIRKDAKGFKIPVTGSQIDLAATLLSQLQISDTLFIWSKDLLSHKVPEFAFVAYNDGHLWIRPWGFYTMDNRSREIILKNIGDSIQLKSAIKEGQSFLQIVFQQYLDK